MRQFKNPKYRQDLFKSTIRIQGLGDVQRSKDTFIDNFTRILTSCDNIMAAATVKFEPEETLQENKPTTHEFLLSGNLKVGRSTIFLTTPELDKFKKTIAKFQTSSKTPGIDLAKNIISYFTGKRGCPS